MGARVRERERESESLCGPLRGSKNISGDK